MSRILVVDDEVKSFLEYVPVSLEKRGHEVTRASYLAEAYDLVIRQEEVYDLVVLDIMLAIREADDEAYRLLAGRSPQGPQDAMRAGLVLVDPIAERQMPIAIVTALETSFAVGRDVHEQVDQYISSGKVLGLFPKPPGNDFYELVEGRGSARTLE